MIKAIGLIMVVLSAVHLGVTKDYYAEGSTYALIFKELVILTCGVLLLYA
jgi:hypothetical protein